ncbi:hypothetical protein [Streptomyces sp. 5-6(2022)]|uniref:hypothetical protein n=1 Tax=Streptomyces sp. 5-6(2022) TaxID=2936510 RepID=UPI0023B93590|nr:hypothetical protein [Streptomyces sp. 5-6(2022)]
MTGPEHYREAERLLAEADNIAEQGGDMGEMIAAAQVHATLAQAAATALIDETPRSDSFGNYRAWQDAAGSSGGDIRNAVH